MKTAVIFWSGTGNTEAMANAVAEGAGVQATAVGSFDGEWMRLWTDRAKAAGAKVVDGEGLICNNTPDDEALAKCRALGEKLAKGG